ncbi:C2H2 type zinc-finger-domain-containing protein [Phaeosphaeriaceae sp. PMI808]|nr:C2H2 type zinc-finger-domain-containing protein [Phaeosphaeriaceae sp. PMI808]
MLSTTSSDLGTNTNKHAEQSPSPLPSRNYLCTSCQISFPNGQEQRIHMKEQWHLYNLKRRIASLPPTTLDEFNLQIENCVEKHGGKNVKKDVGARESSTSSSKEDDSSSDGRQSASPFQCLFCSQSFASDDAGFAANLEHMRVSHGMSIPDSDMVLDMRSFVGYLATEVRVWHECLYCGATKPSTPSIQSHMRDKGHCELNLDREPELLDFWESPPWADGDEDEAAMVEQERPTNLSETKILFASSKVISSRHATSATKKARKRDPVASTVRTLPSSSGHAEFPPLLAAPLPPSNRQLARREEMGILGISLQQRQALVLAEKKAQRGEAVARRVREWVYAKGANSQKFDQVDNQMKWGKQNHKLLPR